MLLRLALLGLLFASCPGQARSIRGPRALELTNCRFQHAPHVRGRSTEFLREGLLSLVQTKGSVRVSLYERPTRQRAGVARVGFKLSSIAPRRLNRQFTLLGERALREKGAFVAAGTDDTWIDYLVSGARLQLSTEGVKLFHEMTILDSGTQVRELVECQLREDVTESDLRHFAGL